MKSKSDLRRLLRARRANFVKTAATSQLVDLFLRHIPLPLGGCIAGYCAMGDEINPLPLLRQLHEQHFTLALPIVRTKHHPMIFGRYKPDDPLVHGIHGNLEPKSDSPPLIPDIVLTPLLGFDRQGHRLGQGGGAYDRTLASLCRQHHILIVGIAWSCQEEPTIPTDEHDIKMDWIITEREAIKPQSHSH